MNTARRLETTTTIPTFEGRELHGFVKSTTGDEDEFAVFFVHGSMAAYDQFEKQIEAMVRLPNKRVVAYDQYGCGKSPRPRNFEAYSTLKHLEDLRIVFDKYKITNKGPKRNLLVGHSFGTTMVLRLASERPEEVYGAVLLGATIREDGGPWLFKLPLFLLEWMHPFLSKGFMERAFHPATLEARTEDHRLLLEKANARNGSNDMHVAQAFYRQWVWTREPVVATLRDMEILLLSGSADKLAPKAHAEEIAAWVDSRANVVTVEVLDPAGHQLMEELYEPVNKHLLAMHERMTRKAEAGRGNGGGGGSGNNERNEKIALL